MVTAGSRRQCERRERHRLEREDDTPLVDLQQPLPDDVQNDGASDDLEHVRHVESGDTTP